MFLVYEVVAVAGMQAGEYPAGGEGDAANDEEGVAEGGVDLCGWQRLAELVEQERAEGDAEADGQLLVNSEQAVAAAGLQGAQVGNGERVHGGVLQRVA